MVNSSLEDFLKADISPSSGKATSLPLQRSHLEEPEGSQPAGTALLIVTAEDVESLVAVSKLVGLRERKHAVPVAKGQGRTQGLSKGVYREEAGLPTMPFKSHS